MAHKTIHIEKIDGMTLKEVFWDFILYDPAIEKVSPCIPCREDFHPSIYDDDGIEQLSREPWPVCPETSGFSSDIYSHKPADEDAPSENILDPEIFRSDAVTYSENRTTTFLRMIRMGLIAGNRYMIILDLLREGVIEAWGIVSTRGELVRIPRAFWSGVAATISFANNAVDQPGNHPLQWTGVELRKTGSKTVPPDLPTEDTAQLSKASKLLAGARKLHKQETFELTPGDRAVRDAVASCFPTGVPDGLKVGDRNNRIRAQLKESGQSVYCSQTYRRYFEKISLKALVETLLAFDEPDIESELESGDLEDRILGEILACHDTIHDPEKLRHYFKEYLFEFTTD